MPKIPDLPASGEGASARLTTDQLVNLLIMENAPYTPNTQTQKVTINQLVGFVTGTTLNYRANLTQSGTAAPVPTVLHSTIGEVVWTRFAAGQYIGTLANTFPTNRTFIMVNQPPNATAVLYRGTRDNNTIVLETRQGGVLIDDLAHELSIMVLLYPI